MGHWRKEKSNAQWCMFQFQISPSLEEVAQLRREEEVVAVDFQQLPGQRPHGLEIGAVQDRGGILVAAVFLQDNGPDDFVTLA